MARVYRRQGIGNYYASQEVWDEIEAVCRAYIEAYPQRTQMRFTLAYYANQARRTDVAFEQYQMIGDTWCEGCLWGSLGTYNKARANALWSVAQRYIAAQDYGRAEELVRKSLALQPNSFEAHMLLAYILSEAHGNVERASDELILAEAWAKTDEDRAALEFIRQTMAAR